MTASATFSDCRSCTWLSTAALSIMPSASTDCCWKSWILRVSMINWPAAV